MHIIADILRDGPAPRFASTPHHAASSHDARPDTASPRLHDTRPGVLSAAELRQLVMEIMG